jgi:hypothetical protein
VIGIFDWQKGNVKAMSKQCILGVIGIIDWRPDYLWTRVENVWQEGIE